MKHKHYDCIVAWANGAKIQCLSDNGTKWNDCNSTPNWNPNREYRIKKEPIIEVRYFKMQVPLSYPSTGISYEECILGINNHDLKITYQDGKAIKAEVAE